MRVAIAPPIATLTLDRPERMNAMNDAMAREVHAALTRVTADDAVRVIVLTGEGRAFCPGADVFAADGDDAGPEPSGEPPLELWHFRVPVLLHEAPQVTVAAVNGACAGAGLGWALACDFRFAARSARFATAFLRVGLAGDMGVPWTLTRLVGGAQARRLLLLDEKLDAERAAAYGMVHSVFPDEDFRAEVSAVVDRLAAAAPKALRSLKEHLVAAERLGFADFVDLETARHRRLVASEDAAEGMAAFAEGRPPRFTGR